MQFFFLLGWLFKEKSLWHATQVKWHRKHRYMFAKTAPWANKYGSGAVWTNQFKQNKLANLTPLQVRVAPNRAKDDRKRELAGALVSGVLLELHTGKWRTSSKHELHCNSASLIVSVGRWQTYYSSSQSRFLPRTDRHYSVCCFLFSSPTSLCIWKPFPLPWWTGQSPCHLLLKRKPSMAKEARRERERER